MVRAEKYIRFSQVTEGFLEASLQFEKGIEKTVMCYLENQERMEHVTSGEYQKYYENKYKDR